MMSAMNEEEKKTTPMMAQWQACKEAAKDSLLLFRMGDFYEAFHDDASVIARELDLTLTKRQDIPMCGVPWHTSDSYIDKLVGKGYRVAVAEQTEDPKFAKGLVKRGIVRVVTPGTLIDSSLLSEKRNNFFASITRVGSIFGLAYLDLTTAEFRVIEFLDLQELINEIHRLKPAEFLTPQRFYNQHLKLFEDLRQSFDTLINTRDDWTFEHQTTYEFLVQHFKVHNLDGFGLKGMVVGVNAAGALLHFLQSDLCLPIEHIQDISTYSTSEFMTLDRMTMRNLELTEALYDGARKNTLLYILDQTLTPMGGRLIRNWIKQPLLSVEKIQKRQNAIEALIANPFSFKELRLHLRHINDLERLMMKISSGYASPRDLYALRQSLEALPHLKGVLLSILSKPGLLDEQMRQLNPIPSLTQLIAAAIADDPPVRLSDGQVIRDGYHKELDELRTICHDSKAWMMRYQQQVRDETGIRTLKVGYNKIFGYYIEVSIGQAHLMPNSFHRKQTLVNAERFISQELKDFEHKVLTAEDKIAAIESELFTLVRKEVAGFAKAVMQMAQGIACIDVIQSLATAAKENHYIKPVINDGDTISIKEGRHPVVEVVNNAEPFVPNDTFLDAETQRMMLITGPNMAGKSTYIRQVAMLAIMAQIGSYIPAKEATIGLVDKVFTRIGASDDLARGHSTFMVEMTETANILHNATSRSLVILDEIGRGTSTYDGISIAWAVAEYLLLTEGKQAKTLFATHYFELTKLETIAPGAVNYHVAVHEANDHIQFLRKIVKGDTDKSYGVHVGRLAGLPGTVISRAKEILLHLEENGSRVNAFEPSKPKKRVKQQAPYEPPQQIQLTLF